MEITILKGGRIGFNDVELSAPTPGQVTSLGILFNIVAKEDGEETVFQFLMTTEELEFIKNLVFEENEHE